LKRLIGLILITLGLGGSLFLWSKFASRESTTSASIPQVRVEELHPLVREAIENASDAIEQQPDSAEAWGNLGMVLVAHDFPESALTCLAEAARLDPAEFRWPYYAGYSQAAFDYETALEQFDRALELRSDYSPLRLRMVQILIQLGEFERCEQILKIGRLREPKNPYLLVTEGRLALLQNQIERAQSLFENAANLPGWMPRSAYQELTILAKRRGDIDRTLEYQKMLDQLPQIGRLEFPDPILERIRELEGLSKSQAERADLALASGDFATAIRLYELLTQRRSDLPTAHVNLAQAYAMSGRVQEAIVAYQQVLDKFGMNIPARMGLAATYQQSGETEAAIEEYNHVLREKPDHKQAWFFLGMIYEQQEKTEDAIRCYRESARVDPSYPQAQLALGVALIQQQEFEQARIHIRRAAELVPGDPTPIEYLQQVERQLKTPPE
jgi:tetratricopeptide (TPR) repeat protein